jgi:hypothetical protein
MKLFSRLLLLIAPSVAIGLSVGVASLALKHLNPGKDPARVLKEAGTETVFVSVLPGTYEGPGCTLAMPSSTSAGHPVTVLLMYACNAHTSAQTWTTWTSGSCPRGHVEKDASTGRSTPVCDAPQK